ncbi:transcription elongation factor A protein 3 isoform X1 [Notothenia coriiceps]|uniref:Transcription elongation factor A protein 3 isoform X1 n=1 Tax=Notothenia coriiceps TaxID=8208 RepID=A0A6I9NAE0_9TELE|nr:PREDICTED: transcription elongation factor A protein 3 isoform X1 [Notothenia coriiceps]
MTREEDLIRIAKKLDKMVTRNNTEGAMDLLKELKSFNMTLKLLQETRIGMSVNGIRKHCTDEEVIALAKVLIKDWKRHLDTEKASLTKNGLDSSNTAGSPSSPPSDTQSSHRRLGNKSKHDSDPDKKHSDKNRTEKHNDEHRNKKRHQEEPSDEKHLEEPQYEKHPQKIRKDKHLEEPEKQGHAGDGPLEADYYKQKNMQDLQGEKKHPEPRKERPLGEHLEEFKKERNPEEPKKHSYTDDMKKGKYKESNRHEMPPIEPQRKKPIFSKPLFERRGVMDCTVLYPTRDPSPPRPARAPLPARPPLPVRRPSVDLKKDRKDGKDSSSRHPRPHAPLPASPPAKRISVEVKKERKFPLDPNAPFAPLPLHLHPPPPRKEPPDPNAPFAPLPFHLHPQAPPPQRQLPDVKKESRKESSDSKPPPQKKTSDLVKKERKESSDIKVPIKHSDEAKRERKDSLDSRPPLPKKPSLDVKKEKHRKDSCDSKPGPPVKHPSTDSKPDRRKSIDSKRSSSPPARKLPAERRESHGSKTPQPGPPQRKPSTDSIEKRGKAETPKTPTTPTSPMSPSFSSPGGPLSPRYATGDSIRDKCIELLAAALRADNDFKDFATNCDSMAAEIEDHIYQESKATDMKYKNKVRSRISNLKDPKNPGLRRNVLAGNIDLGRIASMSAEEMASEELKQLRNVLTQEAIREHQMAKTGGTSSDMFQCSKCRKKNCTYNQVQTRSADEPMTTFVLCNECGNRWKFC